ncbi:MAG: DEAD/DEAH box helicase [Planctomycetota bacterium]
MPSQPPTAAICTNVAGLWILHIHEIGRHGGRPVGYLDSFFASFTKSPANAMYFAPAQAKALQDIATNEPTVIAAETGCGKTLAYLVPIIEKILHIKEVISRLDPHKWWVGPLGDGESTTC